jgi:hypothetical protein
MAREGADAFARARQYDAMGKRSEAIAAYDRAARYLPDTDARKQEARTRLDSLRQRQSTAPAALDPPVAAADLNPGSRRFVHTRHQSSHS